MPGGKLLNCLDLFSGIGGAALALEKTNVQTVGYCDNNRTSQRVLGNLMDRGLLSRAPVIDDVRSIRCFDRRIDIISAGFPCQDVSTIGTTRSIKDGKRTKLVHEVVRLTKLLNPSYVFCENVQGIVSDPDYMTILNAFRRLKYDLAVCICDAASLGAVHRRRRWFLLARRNGRPRELSVPQRNPLAKLLKQDIEFDQRDGTAAALSKLMGNAVVPGQAYEALKVLNAALTSERPHASSPSRAGGNFPGAGEVWVWKVKGEPAFYNKRDSSPECAGGPYALHPISWGNGNTTPKLKEVVCVPCLPTPRTASNTMIAGSSFTDRARRDLGSAAARLDKRKKQGKMLSVDSIHGIMGFPKKWVLPEIL